MIYLDYHATTSMDNRVLQEMYPYFMDIYANASSPHCFGEEAMVAVEIARERVASLINANPEQIFFCSGATEANNIALIGKIRRDNVDDPKLIISPVEHSSILAAADAMVAGAEMLTGGYIDIAKDGTIDIKDIKEAIEIEPNIISIMFANNEMGAIYDIKTISKMCQERDIFFHTDATQAIGRVDIDVKELDVDALSLSAHKIYGPKGVGALYLKNHIDVLPLIHGGYQNTISSGTLNVPAIVGLGKACELLVDNIDERKRIEDLRNYLLKLLQDKIPDIQINGSMQNRLCNNLNISICNVPAEAIIMGMDDVIVSGGSACKSGNHKPSHVLLAMGVDNPECAIRFGLGRWTTKEEIEYAAEKIAEIALSIKES